MCDSRTADKFVLRMPDGLRGHIADQAAAQRRSMNAEIINRLERCSVAIQLADDQRLLITQLSRQIEQLTQDLEHTRGQLVVESVRADVSVEDANDAERKLALREKHVGDLVEALITEGAGPKGRQAVDQALAPVQAAGEYVA